MTRKFHSLLALFSSLFSINLVFAAMPCPPIDVSAICTSGIWSVNYGHTNGKYWMWSDHDKLSRERCDYGEVADNLEWDSAAESGHFFGKVFCNYNLYNHDHVLVGQFEIQAQLYHYQHTGDGWNHLGKGEYTCHESQAACMFKERG